MRCAKGKVEGCEAVVANITSLLMTSNMGCSRSYAASSHIATMKCMPRTPRFPFSFEKTHPSKMGKVTKILAPRQDLVV